MPPRPAMLVAVGLPPSRRPHSLLPAAVDAALAPGAVRAAARPSPRQPGACSSWEAATTVAVLRRRLMVSLQTCKTQRRKHKVKPAARVFAPLDASWPAPSLPRNALHQPPDFFLWQYDAPNHPCGCLVGHRLPLGETPAPPTPHVRPRAVSSSSQRAPEAGAAACGRSLPPARRRPGHNRSCRQLPPAVLDWLVAAAASTGGLQGAGSV